MGMLSQPHTQRDTRPQTLGGYANTTAHATTTRYTWWVQHHNHIRVEYYTTTAYTWLVCHHNHISGGMSHHPQPHTWWVHYHNHNTWWVCHHSLMDLAGMRLAPQLHVTTNHTHIAYVASTTHTHTPSGMSPRPQTSWVHHDNHTHLLGTPPTTATYTWWVHHHNYTRVEYITTTANIWQIRLHKSYGSYATLNHIHQVTPPQPHTWWIYNRTESIHTPCGHTATTPDTTTHTWYATTSAHLLPQSHGGYATHTRIHQVDTPLQPHTWWIHNQITTYTWWVHNHTYTTTHTWYATTNAHLVGTSLQPGVYATTQLHTWSVLN